MKLRLLAMATVAAAALSTPALAGDGWYLGLGGGWDNQIGYQRHVRCRLLPALPRSNSSDNAIGAARDRLCLGGTGWRLENEFAFTTART